MQHNKNAHTLQVLSSSWDGRPFGHKRHGPKIWVGGCAPFSGGQLGPHVTQCDVGQGLILYQVASWSIWQFGHKTWAKKVGGLMSPLFGVMGPHLTQCRLGQVAFWSNQPFGQNRHGPKIWGVGARCSSKTMWPGPRPTSTSSFILIYPIVWPKYTNITDKRQIDSKGEPFYKRSPKIIVYTKGAKNWPSNTSYSIYFWHTWIYNS